MPPKGHLLPDANAGPLWSDRRVGQSSDASGRSVASPCSFDRWATKRRVADEFANLVGTAMNANQADIGEAERFVIATAMAEGYTVLTTDIAPYEVARRDHSLLVEQV